MEHKQYAINLNALFKRLCDVEAAIKLHQNNSPITVELDSARVVYEAKSHPLLAPISLLEEERDEVLEQIRRETIKRIAWLQDNP